MKWLWKWADAVERGRARHDDRHEGRPARIPRDETIELLYDNLPEPIDLDLDIANRTVYWTDRGDPPCGNTVNRAPMDAAPGKRKDPEIVLSRLMEAIGLALDVKGGRMFVTDFAGSVYSANLDGSNKKTLLAAAGKSIRHFLRSYFIEAR